jgi:hypothetical protein
VDPTDASPDLVVEDRFAIVPEWLLDADISDAAVRLYAVLLRYGQSSGSRMPSRATLARRLRKRSTDSVDRAMKELVGLGAVRIEHRYAGAQRLTNAYHVRTSRPTRNDPPGPTDTGSRKSAATPTQAARGGRTDAARVAASSGHDPQHLTQSTISSTEPRPAPTKSAPAAEEEVATDCGLEDWKQFVAEVQQVRRQLGAPTTRRAGPCLAAALQLATRGRGWPPEQAAQALRRVAADSKTRSPMRVAEAGPWWDETPPETSLGDLEELRTMEAALLESGGVRIEFQHEARRALETAGLPITREAVTRGAYQLLVERGGRDATGAA